MMAQNLSSISISETDQQITDCDSTLNTSIPMNYSEEKSTSIIDLAQVCSPECDIISLPNSSSLCTNVESSENINFIHSVDSEKSNCALRSNVPASFIQEVTPESPNERITLSVTSVDGKHVNVSESEIQRNIAVESSVQEKHVSVQKTVSSESSIQEEQEVSVSSIKEIIPIELPDKKYPISEPCVQDDSISISKSVLTDSKDTTVVSLVPEIAKALPFVQANSVFVPTTAENSACTPAISENSEIFSPDSENVVHESSSSESTPKSCSNAEISSCDSSPDKGIRDETSFSDPTSGNDNYNQSLSQRSVSQKCIQEEKQDFDKVMKYMKHLEAQNTSFENEVLDLRAKLNSQEIAFKKAESQIRTEFFSNIEKLSKECNALRKEKEAIVIRYANSEKEVIIEKKVQQELEKKLRDLNKDRDNLLLKIKGLSAENSKLSACKESKTVEIAKLQKTVEKLNADFHSKEIRIKWLQNKLKVETSSHQETQTRLDHTVHRLNEMKEEAKQVRKDCQEMIRCYQEAEEIKSVKLDCQLKQKVSELEVHKQEKTDQEQVYQLLRHELDALKKKQRMTMEENNSLTLKIHSLEKDRLEYEQNLSKLKDSQNTLKQEVVDLTARLAEMETLRLQLEREKEKSAAHLREVERLRSTNAELQADMNACHIKEGELLKFTEGVTDTNVKLQSAHSLLEVKAQALEEDLAETKRELADFKQKNHELVSELETSRKQHEEEIQLLARKLAEKTKNVEKLNIRLDESENENRVLKRRHIASIKELSRELYDCKKRLDSHEINNGVRIESSSLGSRSSSTASLDVNNANENRMKAISPAAAPVFFNGRKETSDSPSLKSSDIPEIDKEMLIERIIKLQKTLARKNDKIDFLEDHIVQLLKEVSKKTKCVDFKTV